MQSYGAVQRFNSCPPETIAFRQEPFSPMLHHSVESGTYMASQPVNFDPNNNNMQQKAFDGQMLQDSMVPTVKFILHIV